MTLANADCQDVKVVLGDPLAPNAILRTAIEATRSTPE